MAVVKNLMVRAGADFSAITKQASKASKSMRGMQSSISRSCNIMSRAASGLNKALGLLGAGASLAALVHVGKEAASAYDEQIAGEMRLATAMRNTMGATNAEIQSVLDLTAAEQKLGIVGDEVQLSGAQQLSTYLSLSSSLQTLIPAMNDLAVQQYGFNVSAEQAASVAKMLGKAMEGQTGALTRYGFTVSEAQAQTLKYGTEAERAATLANIVSQKVGGMNAALAATPTGRMKQLSNALGDVKEQFGAAVRTLGTVFLPILNAIGSALAGLATMANKVAQAIANVFGGSVAGKEWQWAGVSAGVAETADAVDDLTDAQTGSASAAKKQKEALQTASFDTLNILRATDAAGSGGGGGVSSAGGGGGASPITETETAADTASDSLGWLQQKLENLKATWESFRAKLDFTRLKAAWGELKDAVKDLGDAVEQSLGAVWTRYLEPLAVWTINSAAPAALEALGTAVGYVADKLSDLAGLISGRLSFREWLDTLTPIESGLAVVATSVVAVTGGVKLFSSALVGIKAAAAVATAAFAAINWHVVAVIAVLAAFVAAGIALYKHWDSISERMREIAANIKHAFVSSFDDLKVRWSNFKTSVKNTLSEIKNFISTTLAQIRNLFNFRINFPHINMPHFSWTWERVGNMLSLPRFKIDWYAQGGVFDQASLIGVGERGKEAVVPLERNTGWISKVAADLAAQLTLSAGMGSGEALIEGIHDAVYDAMISVMGAEQRSRGGSVALDINGRQFVRAIWDDLRAVTREQGVSLAVK